MAWFTRASTPGPVPLEFRFFDDAQWRQFHAAVERALKRRRLPIAHFGDGVVTLQRGTTHGLLNLAQTCHLNPTVNWVALAEQHFMRITASLDTVEESASVAQLRVRLYPDDYFDVLPNSADGFLCRPFAHGVLAAVVFDLPATVRIATASEVEAVGSAEEVWDLAWAQTRAHEQPDEIEVLGEHGVRLHNLIGDSFFIASLVQSVTDHVDIGRYGALVAIPHRHSVLVHPIESVIAVDAVQLMVPSVRRMFLEGPGSVSPHLYWWLEGALIWQPCIYDERSGSTEFHPTDDLLMLIADMSS